MEEPKNQKMSLFLKLFFVFIFLVLAVGTVFVYYVVPDKVAQSIAVMTKIHKPLTQNPKDYGLENFKDISFTTDDGVVISGWWVPVPAKKKTLGTVLLTHGVAKNREQVLDRAALLVKSGYQTFLFDQRGCGLSGDSPYRAGEESQDFL